MRQGRTRVSFVQLSKGAEAKKAERVIEILARALLATKSDMKKSANKDVVNNKPGEARVEARYNVSLGVE